MVERTEKMTVDCDSSRIEAEVGHILVVDDDAKNRRLLTDVLSAKGHRVSEANNGETGLRCAREDAPDVILLDVMMPKLDGFEVCKRLKSTSASASIPILMVTALHERSDRLAGVAAGADDFISKPIDTEELSLRVRNAIRMKRFHDQTRRDFDRLKNLEQLRDDLTHMIVHDLRSPLMALTAIFDMIRGGYDLQNDKSQLLSAGTEAASMLTEMVNSLLDVSKLEAGEMSLKPTSCDACEIVREATRMLNPSFEQVQLDLNIPSHSVTVQCDRELIRRVVTNLVGNAVKYSPGGSTVTVTVRSNQEAIYCEVADAGPGIPKEFYERVFEKFGQVDVRRKRQTHSTGLGLTFCKLAVEAHGGTIGLSSELGKGSTFFFSLPAS